MCALPWPALLADQKRGRLVDRLSYRDVVYRHLMFFSAAAFDIFLRLQVANLGAFFIFLNHLFSIVSLLSCRSLSSSKDRTMGWNQHAAIVFRLGHRDCGVEPPRGLCRLAVSKRPARAPLGVFGRPYVTNFQILLSFNLASISFSWTVLVPGVYIRNRTAGWNHSAALFR
jgi:hypothetical protein